MRMSLQPAQVQCGLLCFGPCSASSSWSATARRTVSAPGLVGVMVAPNTQGVCEAIIVTSRENKSRKTEDLYHK